MHPARAAHPFAPKLGYEDAERIRDRYSLGESPRALAREFGISVSCLYDVVRGKSYAGRLVVQVTGAEMQKLEALAERTGGTREHVATAILRARLSQIPSPNTT